MTQYISVTAIAVLKKLNNIIIKKVHGIPNPWETPEQGNPSWTGSGYTKLYLWTMVEYELVFYIDADCLIHSDSVVDAFKQMIKAGDKQIAAAPDVFPPDNFNAGVLLIRPSMPVFRFLLKKS